MKIFTLLATFALAVVLVSTASRVAPDVSAQGKKPPETIVLSKESKLGAVAFNHIKHITEKRSPDGTKQIACVECHHTAQPAAEAAKSPPHKTVWPADRTTTLTMELADTDANAVGAICTDCHARANTKPKLLSAIPSLKLAGASAPTVLNNQQAFHINCGVCHDAAVKARPSLSPPPPTSKKCVVCHKKA
jgi:cytochrome c553